MIDDVILGSYADFKLVKTRSVVQVIVEIPVERSKHALDLLGGMPQAGEECAVALVRLKPGTTVLEPPTSTHALVEEKPKRGSLAQQAGILCGEPAFQRYAAEKSDGVIKGDPVAITADFVRETCGVLSRAELDTQESAGQRFRDLKADYKLWLSGVEA